MNFKELKNQEYRGYKEFLLEQIQKGRKICLFGRGGFGQATADEFLKEGIEIAYFIDNNLKIEGEVYRGIECISFAHFLEHKEDYYVIVTMADPEAVVSQLKSNDIVNYDVMVSPYKLKFDMEMKKFGPEEIEQKVQAVAEILADEKSKKVLENIVSSWYCEKFSEQLFSEIYEGNQYFCKDIIKIDGNTVFVDCGAFVGDSFQSFLKNVPSEGFAKAILFELNNFTCEELEKNIKEWCSISEQKKIKIVRKGVSNQNTEISYTMSTSSSSVGGDGTYKAEIVRLDDEISEEHVSLIKMDIEGCEVDALEGARKIIAQHKPTLAICTYHKISDLWEVPLLIKEILPEYKIYLRHHTKTQIETVCYAVYGK